MFGGYRRYGPFANYDFFCSGFFTRRLPAVFHKVLPTSHNKQSSYNYLYRLLDLARKDNLHVYLSATMDSFEGYEHYLSATEDILRNIRKDCDSMNKSGLSGLQK